MRLKFLTLLVIFSIFSLGAYEVRAQTISESKSEQVQLTIPDTNINITGCTAPNSLVYIENDGATAGTIASNSQGLFTKVLFSQSIGIHVVKGFAEDNLNRLTSTQTEVVAVQAQTETDLLLTLSPTVSHAPNQVAEGQPILFSGQACPNSVVNLTIDNNFNIATLANADGLWQIELQTINFSVGLHSYYVTANTINGETLESQRSSFNISAAVDPPEEPPELAETNISFETLSILRPDDGFVSNERTILISGIGPPNTQVEVYAAGQVIGSVFVNALGEWSLEYTLPEGVTSLSVTACEGGQCSPPTEPVEVTYQPRGVAEATCKVRLSLERYRFEAQTKGIDLDILIDEGNPDNITMLIDWGDTTVQTHDINSASYRTHHNYKSVGNYNGIVTIQDGDCQDTRFFSVRVRASQDQDWVMWLVVGSSVIVGYFILFRRPVK